MENIAYSMLTVFDDKEKINHCCLDSATKTFNGTLYILGLAVKQDNVKARQYLEEAAVRGDGVAQKCLAEFLYQNGEDDSAFYWVEQTGTLNNVTWKKRFLEKAQNILDVEKKIKMYETLIEYGVSEALLYMGDIYSNYNRGQWENEGNDGYEKAIEYYEKAFLNGNLEAKERLGQMYYYGYGLERDYHKAFTFLEHLAENGSALSKRCIAEMLYTGRGVDKNLDEAYKWIIKSAKQGDIKAIIYLASMYERGDGVEKDLTQAFNWYIKAAELGSAVAMQYVGTMYIDGKGVKKDDDIGYKWLKKAADLGNDDAMYIVANIAYNDDDIEDYEKVYESFLTLAKKGHPEAMYKVGEMIYSCEYVDEDIDNAFYWMEKAAAEGVVVAMRRIATILSYARNDVCKAFPWWLKGAQAGDYDCMIALIKCYCDGDGVDIDYGKAYQWYSNANKIRGVSIEKAFLNDRNVSKCLEIAKYLYDNDHKEITYRMYLQLANRNIGIAMYELGKMIENGETVKKDLENAKKWYTEAAMLGSKKAKDALCRLEDKSVEHEHKRKSEKAFDLNIYFSDIVVIGILAIIVILCVR